MDCKIFCRALIRRLVDSFIASNPRHRVASACQAPTPNDVGESISHDDTLATASGFLFAAVHVHLLGRAVEAGATTATSRVALHFAVVATDFADNVVEGLVDVDSGLGGSFDELAVERSRKSLALCSKIVD